MRSAISDHNEVILLTQRIIVNLNVLQKQNLKKYGFQGSSNEQRGQLNAIYGPTE